MNKAIHLNNQVSPVPTTKQHSQPPYIPGKWEVLCAQFRVVLKRGINVQLDLLVTIIEICERLYGQTSVLIHSDLLCCVFLLQGNIAS